MSIHYKSIDAVDNISREDFQSEYLRASKPLVVKGLSEKWPAREKWTFDYIKSKVGNRIVPLYDNSKVSPTKKVNDPVAKMPFNDYLDLIQNQPTDLRIFLFNILSHVPELCQDFSVPDISDGFLENYPMMFFGGGGSNVFLHFDIDMSHVFHTQFQGRKKVLLFDPEYSRNLYHVPFGVHNLEEIDLENPDFENYPALKGVRGLTYDLEPGDTLFIPSGWWHMMKYQEGGFALSQRSMSSSWLTRLEGLYNLFVLRQADNFARKLFGYRWLTYKESLAMKRASLL
ncbi:cupin-like domain-containing protein [Aureibacter tunicatorum]|uniref:Ribosomal protein L16 Arg81 hydroxylase n=1 Tax=Aureibacter tunicatorum TaxID=866807 RepID=A0AAE3XPR7_9BACT|nr:cupin-like domain-containing protein [Aureibacter tunicatorum]MDR6240365.1 ribosomal protein L16 Arg81 hydroxylase [Aureibacter tunicatorum]BDD05754.1 hypothetical protein AUTU_32370 [Aureibacter tunicatorum]